jgi:hypothetical protein
MTDMPVDQAQVPRRAHLRLQLGISAKLETLDGRQGVRLIDLSQGGAHVILSQEGEFHQAMLTWLRFETFGMVVWRDGLDVGLEFDKLLPLGVLVETRLRAPEVVREEEEQAAREWVAGTFNPGS